MKALTCEMCGSTDIIKQDGLFVCQSCGTKYSVEEAKKMMVEGTVSVKGVVTVDNSGLIDNYLLMAKNALDAGNKSEAENYCNKIIEINPTHSKAWLFKGNAAGWQSSLANLRYEESIKCFNNALDNDDSEEMKKDVQAEIESLSRAVATMASNHFAEFPGSDSATIISNINTSIIAGACPTITRCGGSFEEFESELFDIIYDGVLAGWVKASNDYHSDLHPSEFDWKNYLEGCDGGILALELTLLTLKTSNENQIAAYKKLISTEQSAMASCSYTYGEYGYVKDYVLNSTAIQIRQDKINGWQDKLVELDPTYVKPSKPAPTANTNSSSGCYVATAVYGSYDCPQVWTLRRFRDYTLAETWYGRAFIKTYYAISPTLVKWFGETNWFKNMWRKPLDFMVSKLNKQGVEDTPYIDKEY